MSFFKVTIFDLTLSVIVFIYICSSICTKVLLLKRFLQHNNILLMF